MKQLLNKRLMRNSFLELELNLNSLWDILSTNRVISISLFTPLPGNLLARKDLHFFVQTLLTI